MSQKLLSFQLALFKKKKFMPIVRIGQLLTAYPQAFESIFQTRSTEYYLPRRQITSEKIIQRYEISLLIQYN